MVSVLEGQLTRTWFYKCQTRNHVINVYHDTITGVRSAMLDFQEIKGSIGSSSLLMESKGHRIFFTVEDLPGFIEIKKSGWTGFSYSCVINDQIVPESTSQVAQNQDCDVFKPKIIETTFTQDELSEHPVAWYVLRTTRLKDNITTTVHRRFKDFAELNSQVKQNLKGNHLRWALPPFPEKPLKVMTDHKDPQFITDRAAKLEIYITSLVAVPHVADMICVKAFMGIMEQVREFSLSFHVPTIGMSLLPCDRPGDSTPAIVGLIQKPDICRGVLPGDSISKINGVPVAGSNFNGVVTRIKALPRPLIIHFIQVIASGSGSALNSPSNSSKGQAVSPSASASSATVHSDSSKALPTFEGDVYGEEPKTWTTYDEADAENTITANKNSAAQQPQPQSDTTTAGTAQGKINNDDDDDADVIVEDLQAVKLSPNNGSAKAVAAPVTVFRQREPEPEIRPSVVLQAPLPLGWD